MTKPHRIAPSLYASNQTAHRGLLTLFMMLALHCIAFASHHIFTVYMPCVRTRRVVCVHHNSSNDVQLKYNCFHLQVGHCGMTASSIHFSSTLSLLLPHILCERSHTTIVTAIAHLLASFLAVLQMRATLFVLRFFRFLSSLSCCLLTKGWWKQRGHAEAEREETREKERERGRERARRRRRP